jgi:hypothetical protein
MLGAPSMRSIYEASEPLSKPTNEWSKVDGVETPYNLGEAFRVIHDSINRLCWDVQCIIQSHGFEDVEVSVSEDIILTVTIKPNQVFRKGISASKALRILAPSSSRSPDKYPSQSPSAEESSCADIPTQ